MLSTPPPRGSPTISRFVILCHRCQPSWRHGSRTSFWTLCAGEVKVNYHFSCSGPFLVLYVHVLHGSIRKGVNWYGHFHCIFPFLVSVLSSMCRISVLLRCAMTDIFAIDMGLLYCLIYFFILIAVPDCVEFCFPPLLITCRCSCGSLPSLPSLSLLCPLPDLGFVTRMSSVSLSICLFDYDNLSIYLSIFVSISRSYIFWLPLPPFAAGVFLFTNTHHHSPSTWPFSSLPPLPSAQ